MELFLNLFIGHLLADYPLQPGRLVAAKREALPPLLVHTALVGAASALVLWDRAVQLWPIVVLAMGAHFAIEKLTVSLRVNSGTRGLFVFAFDQILHVLSIAGLTWFVAGWSLRPQAQILWLEVDVSVNALVAAFLTATFFGSILVFETTNAILGEPGEDSSILAYDLPRVLGIVERAGALALAVWVSPAAAVVAFAPRVGVLMTRPPERRAGLLIGGVSGLALCLACYAGYAAVVAITHV